MPRPEPEEGLRYQVLGLSSDPNPSGLKPETRNLKPHLPLQPFPKLVDVRTLSRVARGGSCLYASSGSGHRGCPEFLRACPDVWLSFIVDPRTDPLDLIA